MKRILASIIGSLLILTAVGTAAAWFAFRVYVPQDMCAVLVRKTGDALPPGQTVATKQNQQGIQEKVLGPGRHFLMPLRWDVKLRPLTVIPAGDPKTWEWIHSLSDKQRGELRTGRFRFRGEFPQIGVVTRKIGKPPAPGQVIVSRSSGVKGILEEVLTPGTYKINEDIYDVQQYPAVVIPAGFVGVVTNLFGDQPTVTVGDPLSELSRTTAVTIEKGDDLDASSTDDVPFAQQVRPLAKPGERGTLSDVLQPGVYFINPKLQKVALIEIGFNEFSQLEISDAESDRITFPSDTGFTIRVGVTVVWGIHPDRAANIINEFGNIDRVLDKVIHPQLRSICRNIGSTYAARDFIQGEKRELFQRDLTAELQRVCRAKNIEILLALIRDIEVHAPKSMVVDGRVPDDLKRTIQESYVAVENQITKVKQRDAATVRAQLEEEQKKIDIARETIQAETRIMVAQVLADGEKNAAQVDAQATLDVATIQQEVAELDAQRTEILGKANADVEKMKNEAEAEGYEMLVGALGGGHAYNLYTFAQNFQPETIRLFFAGDGTFWTDLSRFEELGAAKLLQPETKSE